MRFDIFKCVFIMFKIFQIEEMEEEVSLVLGIYRNFMMLKIRSYRRDFDKLRKDLVRLEVFVQDLELFFGIRNKEKCNSDFKRGQEGKINL